MTVNEWQDIHDILLSYKQQFNKVYPINEDNDSRINTRRIIDIMHNTKNYINSNEELSELYFYGVNSGISRYLAQDFLMQPSDFIGAISNLIIKVRLKIEGSE